MEKSVPHFLLIVNIDDDKYVHVYLECKIHSYLYRTNNDVTHINKYYTESTKSWHVTEILNEGTFIFFFAMTANAVLNLSSYITKKLKSH